jgi:hypothetical protein
VAHEAVCPPSLAPEPEPHADACASRSMRLFCSHQLGLRRQGLQRNQCCDFVRQPSYARHQLLTLTTQTARKKSDSQCLEVDLASFFDSPFRIAILVLVQSCITRIVRSLMWSRAVAEGESGSRKRLLTISVSSAFTHEAGIAEVRPILSLWRSSLTVLCPPPAAGR